MGKTLSISPFNQFGSVGSLLSGSAPKQVGTTTSFTGEQLNLLNQILQQGQNQLGQLDVSQSPGFQASQSFLQNFLQPDEEGLQRQFRSQFVEPSLQTFSQDIIPAIQQRFANLGGGRSSGLNQALSQSAENLQTTLASQLAALIGEQQGRQLGAAGQLGSLSQFPTQSALSLLGLGLTPTQTPIIQPGKEGILGNLIGAGGQIGAAALLA